MSDKYYLPGDQLMSFVCREGTLSIVRVKEIINNNNNKNITVVGHNLSSFCKSLKEMPLRLFGKIISYS